MAEIMQRARRILVSLLPFALRMTPDEVEITLASCFIMAAGCRVRLKPLIDCVATVPESVALHRHESGVVSYAM